MTMDDHGPEMVVVAWHQTQMPQSCALLADASWIFQGPWDTFLPSPPHLIYLVTTWDICLHLNQAILRSRHLGNPGENRETTEKQKALLSVGENRAPVQLHPQSENTRLQLGLLEYKGQ